jgi:lactate permease
MNAFFSSLPILVVLVLMLGLKWPAAKAGLTALALALVLAVTVFGYGRVVYGDIGPVAAVSGALADAVVTGATILWIIAPALCLYQLQMRTGALAVIEQKLRRISTDPFILVILVAWFFTLFLEGAAAFGSTMALAAPFLVALGYRPADALTIVLIGHAVGASWGALGTPVIPMAETTGLEPVVLSGAIGIYQGLLGWLMLLIVVHFAVKAMEGQASPTRSTWGWAMLAAALFLIPFYLVSRYMGPELPNLAGAALGGGLFVLIYRIANRYSLAPAIDVEGEATTECAPAMGLTRAASAYLILIGLVLATRLVPPLQEALSSVVWQATFFGKFDVRFQPLYQPGTLLFLALFLGAWVQRATWTQFSDSLGATLRQVAPVTVALVGMLGLAKIMDHSGMVDHLAIAASTSAGAAWPIISPFVGALGSFITGSATSSNILFTELQEATAEAIGLPRAPILGAQGFGAGAGNMIALHNIIAGGATVGLQGQEGQVLRRTLPVCLLYTLLGGLLAFFLVR